MSRFLESDSHTTGAVFESINGIAFTDASDGAEQVQSDLNDNQGGTVYAHSPDGDVTWSDRVEVPSDTRFRAWGDFTVTLSDESDLDSRTVHGGEWLTVLTNKTDDGTAENVEIIGFEIDFDGDENDDNKAGIWLHDAENSNIQGCTARNVPGSDPGRQFGILLSDCRNTRIADSRADTAGYESIGVRGANPGCSVIDSVGLNGGTHSIQVADFTGKGVDDDGHPRNVTVERCAVDNRVNVDSQDPAIPITNVVIRDCFNLNEDSHVVRLNGHIRNTRLENNQGGSIRLGGNGSTFDGLVVDGHETVPDEPSVGIFGNGENEYRNITVKNVHRDEGDEVIVLMNNNTSSVENVTIENIDILDCTNSSGGSRGIARGLAGTEVDSVRIVRCGGTTDEIFRQEGDGGVTELVELIDCDLSNASTPVAELYGGSVTTQTTNGTATTDLGGSDPDATDWPLGTRVHDSSNGSVHLITDPSSAGGFVTL